MKKLCCIIVFLICTLPALSSHVTGGELYYEYLGTGNLPNTSNYRITLRLFKSCSPIGPQLPGEHPTINIYVDSVLFTSLLLRLEGPVNTLKQRTDLIPCLVGNPEVCYQVAIYTSTITLPNNQSGYLLTRNNCCRIEGISNLSATNSASVGTNYIAKIPGTISLPEGQFNSSPQFRVRDTALVCVNKKFVLDFGATDQDGDKLTYSFCNGFDRNENAPSINGKRPILNPLSYAAPYSGTQPLGNKVFIDSETGIISGIAPPSGQYVVSVCITEWRNGKPFSEHRKDFILKVDDCDYIEANLPNKIVKCDDNTVKFENGSTSSLITSYLWEFSVSGNSTNFSTAPTPTFTYSDTGVYKVRLTVEGKEGCKGIDSTEVFVFPGFKADFNSNGGCSQELYQFTDVSTSNYGYINSWKWDFGIDTTLSDTADIINPKFVYPGILNTSVRLIVTSNKGCMDSVRKNISVHDKPVIHIPFKDTVICNIDSLLIPVNGSGNFSWTPNLHILGSNTNQPIVFPKDTTQYIITISDNGCINKDTITVNVVDYITVQVAPDTTICLADTITLRTNSNALSFSWSPTSTLENPQSKNTIAVPTTTTTYTVIGNLGKCQASDQITVKVGALPQANIITQDTVICYGNRIQLNASYTGTDFKWTPLLSLLNKNSINPIVGPERTILYTLSVRDTISGCPKVAKDSIRIKVSPSIYVEAGRDTSIVSGETIQLNATAINGNYYQWSPAIGLSNTRIHNPMLQLGEQIDSIIYKVRVSDEIGCYGEDNVRVKVFKGQPDIFVPSAFTPNGDGKNDILKPIPVGITELHYFKIYNRWGQLLFSTSQRGIGWNGSFNGSPQGSGTYVYVTQGKNIHGKIVFRKGTAVLIR